MRGCGNAYSSMTEQLPYCWIQTGRVLPDYDAASSSTQMALCSILGVWRKLGWGINRGGIEDPIVHSCPMNRLGLDH